MKKMNGRAAFCWLRGCLKPALFLLIFLPLAGCRSGPVEQKPVETAVVREVETAPVEELPVVSGAAVSVSRYGNVLTDITTEVLRDAGLELGDMLRLQAGSFDGDIPLVTAYSDVPRGNPLVRLTGEGAELAIGYGNFAEKNGVAAGTPVSIKLTKKEGYRAELEIMSLKKSEERRDYSSDAVFANFREVRMANIPGGVLYRSCHPALKDARAPYAARLAEQARITTVINLADNREELLEKASPIPWYQGFINRDAIVPLAMGVDVSSPDFAAKLKVGLQFMISHNKPYLVHCNEGKDRAGYVAALLEALMGASVDEIVADYMTSYVNYYGFTPGEERYQVVSRIMLDILQEMNGGRPLNGSPRQAAENCLRTQIGLSDAEINALRDKLTGR